MVRKISLISVLWLVAMVTALAQSKMIHAVNFTTRDGLGSNVVNCGVQDRQGYIWLGTNHGLTRFDGHRFVNFYVSMNGEQLIEGITHIVEDTVKNVLLMSGKDYRLLCFDLTQMQFVDADGMKFPETNNQDKVEERYVARAEALGIDRGNRTNRRHDLSYVQLKDGRELFATIDNGFFLYEPDSQQLHHYRATDEHAVIESDYINGVLQDRSGGVWLLTTFAGIYQLDVNEGEIVPRVLPTTNIRSFSQLNEKEILVSDMEGNLFRYHLDTGQHSIVSHQGHRVYTTCTDARGRLWIGMRGGGVGIMENLNNGKIDEVKDCPARQIYDIVFAADGTIWIATLDGGLVEGHQSSDDSFVFTQHLKEEKIHEIDLDAKGRLWIAAESGAWVKDSRAIRHVFDKCKVVCICHDAQGVVYAGSNGYGLVKITGEQVEYIQTGKGLANNCVEAVVADHEGNVIAATDQGVSVINGGDGTIRNIYSSEGLMADTYNENAILKTMDGRIFLGSLHGMVELRHWGHSNLDDPTSHLAPRITCLEVNDVPRYDHLTGDIHLSHDQNNLCFSFSSFAYRDISSVIYSCWLEGVDRGWRPSTRESQVLYTNLSPGHYRLHVRSRMADTTWSDETVCDVFIAQPWYWTWWARMLYLLIIALFIWYEWHQYQQRLSLRRQLDQRLTALYAVEVQQEHEKREGEERQDDTVAVVADEEAVETVRAEVVSPELEETGHEKAANQRNKDFLDKLDRIIQENLLQTDLDVNYIAQGMCVSYSTLHRRIKSLTGMTANEYVRKHRLAKAMQLLRDGHNATEVSMQCGFSSPSYFTRCFKSEYGLLPSDV